MLLRSGHLVLAKIENVFANYYDTKKTQPSVDSFIIHSDHTSNIDIDDIVKEFVSTTAVSLQLLVFFVIVSL